MKTTCLSSFSAAMILLTSFVSDARASGVSETPSHRDLEEATRRKRDLYLTLARSQADARGWLDDTHCDALLFDGLYAAAGGLARIEDAEDHDHPGKLHRHWEQDCYKNQLLPPAERPPGKSSGSTISRDMFMGYLQWTLSSRDLALLERVIAYGEAHALRGLPFLWLVGEGDASRTVLTPALVTLLYQTREFLGGAPVPPAAAGFEGFGRCSGYECHLEALHILALDRMGLVPSDSSRALLASMVEKEPRNALFQAIAARVFQDEAARTRAFEILLDESLFPAERLPTSADRCSDYLFQREAEHDGVVSPAWAPCEEGKTHDGIDLIFSASVALGDLP